MFKKLRESLKNALRKTPVTARGSEGRLIGVERGPLSVQAVSPAMPRGDAEEVPYAEIATSLQDTEDAAACYEIGMVELGQRRASIALKWFKRAATLRPDFAPAHFGLGMVLREMGDQSAALDCFKRAIELKHDYIDALLFAAELHAVRGEAEDAEDCYQLALAFDDRCHAARIGLAQLLAQANQPDRAADLLYEVITREPKMVTPYCQSGQLLISQGRVNEAIAVYEEGLRATAEDPRLLVNLGYVYLTQIGDAHRAEELFRRALRRHPEMVDAHANLALAIAEQGRHGEALRYLESLIFAHPDVIEFRWNRGVILLAIADFARGWEDYELRGERERKGLWLQIPFPEWDGSSLTGKQILVYGEQGVGDEIMFASCLPDVISTAERCVVICSARLTSLFQRSFPGALVQRAVRESEHTWYTRFPQVAVKCAMGSLPRFLRHSVADFPRHHGYLMADPARVERWSRAIGQQGGSISIGIAWRSGTYTTRSRLRSTKLLDWLPVLACPNVRFFSLQRGGTEELRDLHERMGLKIMEFPMDFDDLEETASLIAALDLVISVAGTTVHLAGAIGKPVWVLLNHSPEWRYLWRGDTMPWYPSARLFRQPQPGDWRTVMQQVRVALDGREATPVAH